MDTSNAMRGSSNDILGLLKLVNFNFKSRTDLVMLEIGSYAGQSTECFYLSNKFKQIYCIDPWSNYNDPGDFASYTNHLAESEFDKRIANMENIYKLKAFSYEIHELFQNEFFDLIYIDGCHTYEAVKQDIKLYLPKLKADGVLAGHDFNLPGVNQAVIELCSYNGGIATTNFEDSSWSIPKSLLINGAV